MTAINLSKYMYHLKRENNRLRQHAITFSCLGKLGTTDHSDLGRWRNFFQSLLRKTLVRNNISASPLIIGLAESGIIPSGIIHSMLRKKGIHADWICSTRRPSSGIIFTEKHSHAPDHILPFPCYQPTELWFVEDEITTGRTVLHLALKLCEIMNIRQVRFLAIADVRNSSDKSLFNSVLKDHGIEYSLHSMVVQNPKNIINCNEDFKAVNKNKLIRMPDSFSQRHNLNIQHAHSESGWHIPRHRPALRNQGIPKLHFSTPVFKGTLLVVGEAIDIGLRMIQENPYLSFRHVTLSPWETDKKYIFNRLDIAGKYYLYNYHNLKSPLYILNDPIDAHIGAELKERLSEKGFAAEYLANF